MFDMLPTKELDSMPPGPALAAALDRIDVGGLSGYELVVVLRAQARMRAHYDAAMCASMVAIRRATADELSGTPLLPGEVDEAAAAEIGCALHLTRRSASGRLGDAMVLLDRLPAVWQTWAAGRLDWPRVRVILDETAGVAVEEARRIVDDAPDGLLADAPGLTTTQLRRRLRRACLAADPTAARRRYEHGIADRRVIADANPDGTAALLGLELPPDRVAAARRYLDRCARHLRRQPGETRTMDQLRADVYLDLLSGSGAPAAGKGTVDLRVDVATLVGLSEVPGNLGGYGPILADLARQVAMGQPDVEWRYAVTDPDTGAILRTGTTRRRPTSAQRRYVQARHATCPFPGCVAPSTVGDIDHITPWSQGGPTTVANLAPPCPTHHAFRHRAGWSYAPTSDTDFAWTTALGHRYTTSGVPP